MTTQEIEDAALTLADFWQADEQGQEAALEVASKCVGAILRMIEEGMLT